MTEIINYKGINYKCKKIGVFNLIKVASFYNAFVNANVDLNDIVDSLDLVFKFIKENVKFKIISGLPEQSTKLFFSNSYTTKEFVDEFKKYLEKYIAMLRDNYNEENRQTFYFGVRFIQIVSTSKNNKNRNQMILSSKGGNFKYLPLNIRLSKCVLNIKNNDNFCFIWSILAFLFPVEENRNRTSKYKEHFKKLNIEGFEFPMKLTNINDFCLVNKLNISVLHLNNDADTLTCVYNTSNPELNDKNKIMLLLYDEHYSLILDLDSLFKCTLETKNKVYVCPYCMECHFYSSLAFDKHMMYCTFNEDLVVFRLFDGPKDKAIVKFKNTYKKMKIYSCVYADFEVILEPVSEKFGDGSEKTFYHKPIAVGTCHCINSSKIIEKYHFGQDCVNSFLIDLIECGKRTLARYNNAIQSISKSEIIEECCKICEISFKKNQKQYILKDIGDLTNVLGNAHERCLQLYYKSSKNINVLFHNLKGYDSHLFVDKLAENFIKLSCIPISKEKYISFSCEYYYPDYKEFVKFKFLDSLGFLTGSLSSNADNLSSFKFINTIEPINSLNRKLPFPYEYISSEEVLYEESLPNDPLKWYSSLNNNYVDKNEIALAIETFNKFGCKTIKDYMMLYLRMDVLLLTEVFEEFRRISLVEHKLDPLHYYTTPGFAWDCALKYSKISLDILTDKKMVSFFSDKGVIRGGISTISELKYANTYSANDKNILYFDVTNLYGFAMTHNLPVGDFQLTEYNKEESVIYIKKILEICENYDENQDIGYIFEVDISYPQSLHLKHNPLPFLVENVHGKLIPMLNDKLNYRLHIVILIQCLKHGLILERIHKIITFKQKPWLRDYVMMNTEKRAATNDPNMRNFFKLMNNAVYGKTIENVLLRENFKIYDLKTWNKKCLNPSYMSKFKEIIYLTKNIVVASEKGVYPLYDKPVYVGFTVLEISKRHMYFLLYDVIKPKWPQSMLMYMDTDSLIVYCPYELDYNGINQYFDLSGYVGSLHKPENKGVLGTLKDEYPKDKIIKFICLKSKCYILQNKSGKVTIKNKGITQGSLKNVTFKDFENMLEAEYDERVEKTFCKQTTIKSFEHKVFTVQMNKVCLSSKDDKRRIDKVTKYFDDKYIKYMTLPLYN